MDQKIKLILIGVGVVALIVVLALLGVIPGLKKTPPPAAQLDFWGLEEEEVWVPVISKFEEKYPNINVKYRKISSGSYEDTLLNNLAEAGGPDIFVIKNSWVSKYKKKVYPFPQQYFQFSTANFRRNFVDATNELITDNQILGLPLFVDTPVLLYNRDMFNASEVAQTPRTWEELLDILPRLNRKSQNGDISRSAVALGTARNINGFFEILNSLVFQFGDKIFDTVAQQFQLGDGAERALSFYSSFADNTGANYSWNLKFGQSLDAFAQEKTAMAFAFASDLARLRAKNPHLNFDVLPFPQPQSIRTPVVYGSYVAPVVSMFSKNITAAWEFLYFAAAGEGASIYVEASGLPPARRDFIAKGASSEDAQIFYRQALIAKTWPVSDERAAKKIFEETMLEINAKSLTPADAVVQMLSQLSLLQP